MFEVQNMYDSLVLQELFEKKEYQKIVDYYLNNMANQNYYTTGVMMKYADRLVTQLGFATEVNKEFLNKNQENYKNTTFSIYWFRMFSFNKSWKNWKRFKKAKYKWLSNNSSNN